MKQNKAFTVIELVIVMAILGILVLLASSNFSSYVKAAKTKHISNDIRVYEVTLEGEKLRKENLTDNWLYLSNYTLDKVNISNELFNKKGEILNNVEENLIIIPKDKIKVNSSLKGTFLLDKEKDEVLYYNGHLSGVPKDYVDVIPNDDSDFIWTSSNSLVTIVGYKGTKTDVMIPDKLGGETVVAINNNAFNPNTSNNVKKAVLTSVLIPNTVTTIEEHAFYGNSIKKAFIPDSVTKIGAYSFANNLLEYIEIPEGINFINTASFYNNKLKHVSIPKSVVEINSAAFQKNKLKSVEISNNVETIGNWAFESNLIENINIPTSVKQLGNGAFANNLLKSVIIPDNVKTIGESTFAYNKITNVVIPESITKIGNSLFRGNLLTSINIPESVTSIGEHAFRMNNLQNVTIPENVASIGQYAFASNVINQLNLKNNVPLSIGDSAFRENRMKTLKLPEKIISIGELAFYDNNDLKEVTNCSMLEVDIYFDSVPAITNTCQ